ncbi:MAG: DUF6064 family protein [Pseudomonadota bacterium]
METWLTYRPRDFLLFSPDTYWRLFEAANDALWPWPLVAAPVLVVLVAFAATGRRRAAIALALALAVCWVVVSEAVLAVRYEPINWAVAYIRPLFLVEAALLASLGLRLSFPARGMRLWVGGGLIALGAAYPLVGVAAGRTLSQAEAFGMAPDPTAVATLGVLLAARPSWAAVVLAVVPIFWLTLSAVTLHTMEEATFVVPAAVAALGVVSLAVLRRRAES